MSALPSNGIAVPQPCRVDAHGCDIDGFANPLACNGLRQFDDVTFDVGVDLHSKNADPITGAAERDPLVSSSTSLSKPVACRYGTCAAHFAWRYSNSGVTRL